MELLTMVVDQKAAAVEKFPSSGLFELTRDGVPIWVNIANVLYLEPTCSTWSPSRRSTEPPCKWPRRNLEAQASQSPNSRSSHSGQIAHDVIFRRHRAVQPRSPSREPRPHLAHGRRFVYTGVGSRIPR